MNPDRYPAAALLTVLLGQGLMAGHALGLLEITGMLVFILGAVVWDRRISPKTHLSPISSRLEIILVLAIMACAAVFRTWKLDTIPPGAFGDFGYVGLAAQRILNEGWRPGPVPSPEIPDFPTFFYLLAGWFKAFGGGFHSFLACSVTLSLAGLAVFYIAVRRMTGVQAALPALFCLAFMRWHVTFSRNTYPLMATLAALLAAWWLFQEAVRGGKAVAWALWGLTLGWGLWTHPIAKVAVVWFGVLMVYEYYRDPGFRRQSLWKPGAGIAILAVSTFPFLIDWLMVGPGGTREGVLWFWKTRGPESLLSFLAGHLASYLFMFNAVGDGIPRHNIHDLRMLDDGTGILFGLGMVSALRHWKDRPSFYALTGFSLFLLPGLLTSSPAHSTRVFGTVPFVAILAGLGAQSVLSGVAGLKPGRLRKAAWAALALIAFGIAASNWVNYFKWGTDPVTWDQYSVPETGMGERVESAPPGIEFRVATGFLRHFSFEFTAYDRLKDCKPLKPDNFMDTPADGPARVRYILEPAQTAYRAVLLTAFPKALVESVNNPKGEPVAYQIDVPSGDFKPLKKDYFGLRARFFLRTPQGDRLFLDRVDRVVNYTNGNDFPRPPGKAGVVVAQWTGWVDAPRTGDYSLGLDATGPFKVKVDGKTQETSEGLSLIPLHLTKGKHPFELDYMPLREWDEKLNVNFELILKAGIEDLTLNGFAAK